VGLSNKKTILLLLVTLCIGAAAYLGWNVYRNHATKNSPDESEAIRYQRPDSQVAGLLDRTDAAAPSLSGKFPCVFANVAGPDLSPQVGECDSPVTSTGAIDRFEADLRYGRFILRQTDLYMNDGFDVPLTRTYNSGDYIHPNRVHAFGKNANHPFDIAPLGTKNPYTYQLLVLEDGNFIYFDRVSPGVGYADAIYQHVETGTKFYKAVTAWNGNGWTTWLKDGSGIVFPEASQSKSMAESGPTEMVDAAGNRVSLMRDGQHNLQEIRTPRKHAIRFTYDDARRIVRAEDDSGKWAEYLYSTEGMLTDVNLYSGRKRHYSYDGVLMTQVEDENRKVLLHNTYNGGFLFGQDFGNGQVFSFEYSSEPGEPFARSVIVTLPDGTRTNIELGSAVPEFVKHPHQ
jgi:YD repeat-containing protein